MTAFGVATEDSFSYKFREFQLKLSDYGEAVVKQEKVAEKYKEVEKMFLEALQPTKQETGGKEE
jgi:hypothetical protein